MTALPEGYLEIYKLSVEMADRVSARRAVASSFFLTVLSGLVALVSAVKTDEWTIAVPGLILAVAWWTLLSSYRRLNTAKFEVIQALETHLPAAPYTDEWTRLKATPPQTKRYFELGLVEQIVPMVFGLIFVGVLIDRVV